jgi:hypothetical protein
VSILLAGIIAEVLLPKDWKYLLTHNTGSVDLARLVVDGLSASSAASVDRLPGWSCGPVAPTRLRDKNKVPPRGPCSFPADAKRSVNDYWRIEVSAKGLRFLRRLAGKNDWRVSICQTI